MKTSILMVAVVGLLASGCASTQTVKEAKGQGVTYTYPFDYEAVYNATLAAAKFKNLEVVEQDKTRGQLILSHGVTPLSWGERIAVFVKPLSASRTEEEIISKPVLAPLNFPPDWQQILFNEIEVELQTGK